MLAVYFDKNNKVIDKAVYGKEDGRLVAIESRRTPSFGEDRTFLQSTDRLDLATPAGQA